MKEMSLFALLFCNLFLQAQQAYFSSKPPPGVIKAKIGEDVIFPWNFTLEAGETLILMQLFHSKINAFENSAELIAYRVKQDPLFSINKPYQGRVSVEETGTLTLHNVSVEQRGFYKCAVSLTDQAKSVWDKAQLLVGIPPVIHSTHTSEIVLLEGDHLDITCEASGSPVPNVSWYKQMQHGWKKLSERRLQIKNVKQSDSGNYKCSATNYMGSEEKTMTLSVYERPVTTFFHTGALDDTVYECDEITFTCEARANRPPVTSIYIYHEGRLVHRSINNDRAGAGTLLAGGRRKGRLRIARVKKEHEGRYYCVAENEHGVGYNKSIDLKVFDAPGNCKRATTVQTTITTKLQISSVVPTDSSSSTTDEDEIQGKYSSSYILRPSLLLFSMWTWHLAFCWFS